jgi:hypothetical protein
VIDATKSTALSEVQRRAMKRRTKGTSVGLRSMMAQGIDRSTEAKGETETEGYPETIATVGVSESIGSQCSGIDLWYWGFQWVLGR